VLNGARLEQGELHVAHIIQELIHVVALLHETGILDALEHAHDMFKIIASFVG
jgi:uncharacterized protein YjgD (DUF1641 family)